jgi:hypothetical protein
MTKKAVAPRDCHHGSLARSCLTCEQEREIAELRSSLEQARALLGECGDALATDYPCPNIEGHRCLKCRIDAALKGR